MSRRRTALVAAALAAPLLLVTGCGGSSAAAPAPQDGPSCTKSATAGAYKVDLALTPCPVKAGSPSSALVTVRDDTGKAVSDATVRLAADMPAMKMNAEPVDAPYTGSEYQGRILLGMSGPWKIKVQLRQGAGQPAEATFDVDAT